MSVSPPDPHDARFRALFDVSRAITAALDFDELLSIVCQGARELLGAESALVTRLRSADGDRGSDELEIIATTKGAGIRSGQLMPLDGSLSGAALMNDETLVVNDVPNAPAADHEVAAAASVHQAVVAPLRFAGEPLGTLAVWNSAPGSPGFDDGDGEILGILAAQAAVALRNALLFDSERRAREEAVALEGAQEQTALRLRGLVRAGMALTSQLALDEVLQTVVDSAREVVGARYAALGVLDRSGTSLARFLFSGIEPERADEIGPLPTGKGILGLIIREARTLRLGDLKEHPAACGFPEDHPPMRSFLGVPIRAGGRVFGNLYLTEKVGAPEFGEQDEELAELLAAQAAIAIENANLYQQRNQFLAIVNHEIKNAAAGVLGWTDRLLKLSAGGDQRLHESARYASEGARQLHSLVVDLLDLSRIEARKLDLEIREVDLRALIREVVGTVRPEAEKQGIRVTLAGVDQRVIAETDPTRVRQILLNLLSNAMKFLEEGGEIQLEVGPGREGWCVTVRDSGPGVEPGMRERLFEAYSTSSGRSAGMGLGLAISRELARLLGGDLSLETDDQPGACFRLAIPEKPSDRATGTDGSYGTDPS